MTALDILQARLLSGETPPIRYPSIQGQESLAIIPLSQYLSLQQFAAPHMPQPAPQVLVLPQAFQNYLLVSQASHAFSQAPQLLQQNTPRVLSSNFLDYQALLNSAALPGFSKPQYPNNLVKGSPFVLPGSMLEAPYVLTKNVLHTPSLSSASSVQTATIAQSLLPVPGGQSRSILSNSNVSVSESFCSIPKIVLLAKALTRSDAHTRRLILPRLAVEANLPYVVGKLSYNLEVVDSQGLEWQFTIRSWPNGANPKPVYVLERISEFIKAYGVGAGDVMGLCTYNGRVYVEVNTENVMRAAKKTVFMSEKSHKIQGTRDRASGSTTPLRLKSSTEAPAFPDLGGMSSERAQVRDAMEVLTSFAYSAAKRPRASDDSDSLPEVAPDGAMARSPKRARSAPPVSLSSLPSDSSRNEDVSTMASMDSHSSQTSKTVDDPEAPHSDPSKADQGREHHHHQWGDGAPDSRSDASIYLSIASPY